MTRNGQFTVNTFQAQSRDRAAAVQSVPEYDILFVTVFLVGGQTTVDSPIVTCVFEGALQRRSAYRGGAIFTTLRGLQSGALPPPDSDCSLSIEGVSPNADRLHTVTPRIDVSRTLRAVASAWR